ncbi:hypothetical protein ACTXT7_002669 [Hymenolepis weldensis]
MSDRSVLQMALNGKGNCLFNELEFSATLNGAVAVGSEETRRIKLTWRWVQGDQGGSGPRWRLTIALRCVEACDGLTMGLLGRTVFESGEAFGSSLKMKFGNSCCCFCGRRVEQRFLMFSGAVAVGSEETRRIKLTWRWVQGDQGGSGPRWRLTIALRCVEACDGLTMGLLGRTVFESGEAFGSSLNWKKLGWSVGARAAFATNSKLILKYNCLLNEPPNSLRVG